MKRRPDQHPTMADIVAEAKVDIARAAREREAAEQAWGPCQAWIEGEVFTVSDEEITAEEALAIAQACRLVVHDSCGSGLDYEIWEGKSVSDLTDAGRPIVQDGFLWRIEDEHGRVGVLVEQDVRWGALR